MPHANSASLEISVKSRPYAGYTSTARATKTAARAPNARAAAAQATTDPAKSTAMSGQAKNPPATSRALPTTTGVAGVRKSIAHGSSGCQSRNWM